VSERDVERNVGLAEHQRHCVSPDRLLEAVYSHVQFRAQHGERSHSYELLHSPRLLVVQDNVEVVEHRDAALYSTVTESPSYRFTMETATNNRPGKQGTGFAYKTTAVPRVTTTPPTQPLSIGTNPPNRPDCAPRYERVFGQEKQESFYFTAPTYIVEQLTSCVLYL
jgi:hypothetical protein